MVTFLIRWVVLGSMQTVSVETVPAQLCTELRAEAVSGDTVKAAACVTTGEQIAEALRVGECRYMPDVSLPELRVYACNGRMPRWN